MLRSHPLLRDVHDYRKVRRRRSHDMNDPSRSLRPLQTVLRSLEADGLMDPAHYDDFEDGLVNTILTYVEKAGLAQRGAQPTADKVFGEKLYVDSLSRRLGICAKAAAYSAIEERVWLAALYVMRQLSIVAYESDPTYPSAECTQRAIAAGKLPRQYVELRANKQLGTFRRIAREHPDWTMDQLADETDRQLALAGSDAVIDSDEDDRLDKIA